MAKIRQRKKVSLLLPVGKAIAPGKLPLGELMTKQDKRGLFIREGKAQERREGQKKPIADNQLLTKNDRLLTKKDKKFSVL